MNGVIAVNAGRALLKAGMEVPGGKTSNEGPFIFWDGEECQDTDYSLFGCSIGGARPDSSTYLQAPFLSTREMLDLLLSVAEDNRPASHVGFVFDYDVNQILHELDWKSLATLRAKGEVRWDEYKIEHIPGKIFKVSAQGSSVRVDDCFSFFRKRYDKVLRQYGIGDSVTVNEISSGKDNRADFWYRDIDQIREYMFKEIMLGCDLMEKIRKMCHRAGYHVKQWYGPGALAAYSLREHRVSTLMKPSPPQVHAAALSAYAGGWFERFKMGMHDGPAYTYDINSAYVFAMSQLPDLTTGTWEHVSGPDAEVARRTRFGLFRVEWNPDFSAYMRACHGVPFPLFHRDSDGSMHRPVKRTSVWLWSPEAANATATPYAELKEAWIYHDNGSEPFAWVAEMYNLRLALQAENDPAEKILKWAMASYYGRLAQRTGWNEKTRTAPKYHQIEWAGWITSKCRSMVYQAALSSAMQGGLVSIDTDGIITTVPIDNLPNGTGNQLGRWKEETYDGLIYLQNGVYWLHCPGCSEHEEPKWHDPKLRGIPRTKLDPEMGIQALRSGGILELDRRTFVGYGAALQRDRSEWRQWVDRPVKINAQQCGSRIHVVQTCRQCRDGLSLVESLHELSVLPERGLVSKPHSLPWLEAEKRDESAKYEQCELF